VKTIIVCTTICIAMLSQPAMASSQPGGLLARRAFFESTQVAQLFFACLSDSANADDDSEKLNAAERCLRSTLDDDIVFEVDFGVIEGIEQFLGLVLGTLAEVRTNTSTQATAFSLEDFQREASGRQSITISTVDIVIQEVVAPFPLFGETLGPQLAFVRDVFTLKRTRSGDWRITRITSHALSIESRPDANLFAPFPTFGRANER